MPDLVDEHEEILKAPIRVACQNEDETELIRRYRYRTLNDIAQRELRLYS